MTIKQINFDTNEYWQALRMREIVLRIPLGMRYSLENILSESGEIIFVVQEECKIIASCQFIINHHQAKMRQVATTISYQGKGVGKSLLEFAQSYLKSKGVSEIYCHARLSAVQFYLKQGFEVYSEEFIEVGIPHFEMRKLF